MPRMAAAARSMFHVIAFQLSSAARDETPNRPVSLTKSRMLIVAGALRGLPIKGAAARASACIRPSAAWSAGFPRRFPAPASRSHAS